MSLEKNVFNKKWSPKLIFLDEIFFWKKIVDFDIENLLWKYNFGIFWRTIIHRRIDLKQFPLSMLILGQIAYFFRPTIFKIPQPNWHCIAISFFILKISTFSLGHRICMHVCMSIPWSAATSVKYVRPLLSWRSLGRWPQYLLPEIIW